MNITDEDGNWRITANTITNLKTGDTRPLNVVRMDNQNLANAIAFMPYGKFQHKCAQAFETGQWPLSHYISGRTTY